MRDETTRPEIGGRGLSSRDDRERALLALLFLGAFIVRLWGLSHRHGWDENVYLQNALLVCCGKNNYNEIDSRPPLLSLLFAGVFRLWRSDYAAWILTAVLNALGPIFLYLAGRKLVSRSAAAIASGSLVTSESWARCASARWTEVRLPA